MSSDDDKQLNYYAPATLSAHESLIPRIRDIIEAHCIKCCSLPLRSSPHFYCLVRLECIRASDRVELAAARMKSGKFVVMVDSDLAHDLKVEIASMLLKNGAECFEGGP